MNDSVVPTLLALAAGIAIGFTQGRIFERWEFTRKGYRKKRRDE